MPALPGDAGRRLAALGTLRARMVVSIVRRPVCYVLRQRLTASSCRQVQDASRRRRRRRPGPCLRSCASRFALAPSLRTKPIHLLERGHARCLWQRCPPHGRVLESGYAASCRQAPRCARRHACAPALPASPSPRRSAQSRPTSRSADMRAAFGSAALRMGACWNPATPRHAGRRLAAPGAMPALLRFPLRPRPVAPHQGHPPPGARASARFHLHHEGTLTTAF